VLFAPGSVFLCGLVIALGNRLSAGLPPRVILISGAVLPKVMLNVPLSTVLLTRGMGTVVHNAAHVGFAVGTSTLSIAQANLKSFEPLIPDLQ
jgi:hypothetical protein